MPNRTYHLSVAFTLIATLAHGQSQGAQTLDTMPLETPYKYGSLILEASTNQDDFDSKGVDSAFVFSKDGTFYMTYVGFDGVGYQTGLAESKDLVHWRKDGIILRRNPHSKYTRFNASITSILRDDALRGSGEALKVDGDYIASWNAFPESGYEAGAAVIGLAKSKDLRHWHLTAPILIPGQGAAWEKGGLYKSYIVKDDDIYYVFYNAKNDSPWPWIEQTGFATSSDLITWKRSLANPIICHGSDDSLDARFASDPAVYRYQNLWVVYYFGLSLDLRARELLAIGADPEHLSKSDHVIINLGPAGSIDDRLAHKPAIISWRGDLYHFYTAGKGNGSGEGDNTRGITVARSRPW